METDTMRNVLDEFWVKLIRHWLGFPAIVLGGSFFSVCFLVPRGLYVPEWGWALIGMAYFLSVVFYLCPRCGKQIDSKGARDTRNARSFGYYPEQTCPRCLRTRIGVRKFQRWYAPEPWDGVRHDEI
jgi:hypothetical protein